jgi:isopentenyl-diphosphate delta-isomerase
MSRILIVNKEDTVIGSKERGTLDSSDIYRVSALWLTNSKGEVLMARRALTKSKNPGLWGPAVAGTVEEGESYANNIVKEIKEEIGLDVTVGELEIVHKKFRDGSPNRYFCQWYSYAIDMRAEDFVIAKDEVAEVRWMTVDEIRQMLLERPDELISSAMSWTEDLLK